MAMVPNCYLVLKLSLLLSFAFLFFALTTNAASSVVSSNGLPGDVRAFGTDQQRKGLDFCEQMPDPSFCWIHIGNTPQWDSVTTYQDVFSIAVDGAIYQVYRGQDKIMEVRPKFNGPIGKNRIAICETKFDTSAWNFNQAWGLGKIKLEPKKLNEISKYVYNGVEALRECEDEWKKNGPPQKSPLTNYYQNVTKLNFIMRLALKKMHDKI